MKLSLLHKVFFRELSVGVRQQDGKGESHFGAESANTRVCRK